MSEDLEKIMLKARKLKELFTRADIEGEKQAAEAAYKSHLKKHNLNDSDINPEMNNRVIPAKDEEYRDVLLNVILSVNPYTKHSISTSAIQCYLDNEDYNEVLKKFDYFSKMLAVEKELLITAFLSKHSRHFEPDSRAKSKWRERRVENSSKLDAEADKREITQELNRLQAEAALNIDVTQKVINSGSRIKIAAFNKSRAHQMVDLLLDAEYARHRTRIGKETN